MTGNQAIARVQRGLGFRTDLVDQIIIELNQARIEAEDDRALGEPWFLRQEITLVLSGGTQLKALPSNFIRLDEDSPPYYYDATQTDDPWIELEVNSVGYLRANVLGTGPPQAIALVGTNLLVFPTPNSDYTLKMYALIRGVTIAANDVETEWLRYATNMLCGTAGIILAGDLGYRDAVTMFAKMRDEARVKLMRQIEDHAVSGQRLEMGGPD